MRVVTAAQMKQLEAAAVKEYDLTYQRLMENAGSAAAAFIRRTFSLAGLNCMIFCGGGNNGGDGFVASRKLIENGANVLVVLVGGKPKSAQAAAMYETVELMGMPVLSLEENYDKVMSILEKADIVVDAIYGTGFGGELDIWAEKACEAINDAIAAVISLDIPSGVESDSGKAAKGAVNADFTVVFDSMKPAHILPASKARCGVVEVVDIGIPEEARESIESVYGEIRTAGVLKSLKARKESSHKGDFGKLLIVAGCSRYRGAAALATLAALRCGTGLVTLASTKPVLDAAAAKLYECIYIELAESGSLTIDAASAIPLLRESLATSNAVLFGCGIDGGPDAEKLLRFIVSNAKCPIVLDADGINALSANINILKDAKAPVVLTPHPGEMSRLCGKAVHDVEEDRYGAAVTFAEKNNAYVVLKGHETVIASPDNGLLINHSGNAGLSKAGSGDVLAGMLGAFLAQGIPVTEACAAGVHLHGLAADKAAEDLSKDAMLPSDLPEYLGKVLRENGR